MTTCMPAIQGQCRAQAPTLWQHRDFTGGSLAEQGRWKEGGTEGPGSEPLPLTGALRAALTAGETEASPQPRSPHTAPPHPPPGSPLPTAGRWKPMMRLIRSSEFMSSFLRRSSARRWDAESPAGSPGAAGAAPAPPSAIPGTTGPARRARPAQRAGAATARPQPLKPAPPSCVRAGEGRGALGELYARPSLAAPRPHSRWPPRPRKWRSTARSSAVRAGRGDGGAEGTRWWWHPEPGRGWPRCTHRTISNPSLRLCRTDGAHWGNTNRQAALEHARATGTIEQGAYSLLSSKIELA